MTATVKTGAAATPKDATRNQALDFSKGILVLFMVLYHWLNYFVVSDGMIYRYLRFITPSFIFLTGFLIGSVYLTRYTLTEWRLYSRLVERGLKLLAIFTALNVGAAIVLRRGGDVTSAVGEFVRNLFSVYVVGSGETAAFEVLVPISYLIVLAAPLLFLSRWTKYVFHIACGISIVAVLWAGTHGVTIPNLELLSMGLLGFVLGYVPLSKINQLALHWPFLILAYAGYLIGVTVWDVIYPLQVVGVCLTVTLIYLWGVVWRGEGGVLARILILGRYSLLAYIAQIVILQILRKALGGMADGAGKMAVTFVAVLLLTQLTIEITEVCRSKWKSVDRLYKFVFA
ncbi:MAG TPA: hypothetical protein PKA41_11305 [Verrucomicrobiota bacterium]|nr:hypothetical protein [Verrucomicrobiota bacterium]